VEVERDDDALAAIVDAARPFMEAVRRKEMPAAVELTYYHQVALHPTSTEDTVELDERAQALVVRLDTARAIVRNCSAEEERVRAELAGILGDTGTGTIEGRTVVTWRTQQRSSLDAAAVRRQHPEIAERFTTTTSYRVMRTSLRGLERCATASTAITTAGPVCASTRCSDWWPCSA
jgi:predicted phage-related endonuclease